MNLILKIFLLSFLTVCLADEAIINATSNWVFPPGAQNSINFTYLEASVQDYLRTAATQNQTTGWASSAVHAGDSIDIKWRNSGSRQMELWCLNCWNAYQGTSGRDACNNYTNDEATNFQRYDVDTSAQGWRTVSQQSATVSAGICAYGFKGIADVYDITVAYPYVNPTFPNTEDVRHDFSVDSPAGKAVAPISTSSTTLATRTTRTSRTSTRTYSYYYPTYSSHHYSSSSTEKNSHAGAIAGGVIGASAGFLLLLLIIHALRSSHEKHENAIRLQKRPRTFQVTPYNRPTPTRRPVPVTTPSSSASEGEVRPPARRRDTDGDDMPPPAYEEVVVDAVRQAESGHGSEAATGVGTGQAVTTADTGRQLPSLPGASTEANDGSMRRRSSW
ncbi:hypothetical protein BDV96DRAFT_601078 [Lophiotrema nucula]|uniref:Mid2 domain-containing protein n=1 Tax=Lophiotrema nucula TaxID=690887 RepID=A0A6A5Z3E4_9PLEO|nr:hypothetical protein BDV96DRAFT_601078 [Lophiotrema nucula]